MKYIVDAKGAKSIDEISINKIGIPSLVLMERAALFVAKIAKKKADKQRKPKILCVCGSGNNGADGIATARILCQWGYDAKVFLVKKSGTKEFDIQLEIAKKLGVKIRNKIMPNEYTIIVDGLFGVGCNRPIDGQYAQIIEDINKSDAYVIAVDVPSGVDSTNGHILKCAVKADETVTFGYTKFGLMLYPGAQCAGKIHVKDIGFAKDAIKQLNNFAFTFSKEDLKMIPERKKYSNKGTFGKVLIIAGSKDMGGAACLASLAAYRTGAGLVRVFTHENQRLPVLKIVPEAIVETYQDEDEIINIQDRLQKAMEWSSCIVVGPGLSTSDNARMIVKKVIDESKVTTIFDADALNIIAMDDLQDEISNIKNDVIITPHLGEMARLINKPIQYVQENIVDVAKSISEKNSCVCVLKDARTIVSNGKSKTFVNSSGNSGMASGGSGDVLAGVIAGLNAIGMDAFDASCMGVYIHGLGGDFASKKWGAHGMKAKDIIEGVTKVMSESRGDSENE